VALARYCLDTSAYSQFKRGHGAVVRLIVLGELWMGFGLGDRARRNERELRAFLANPVVEILAVDAEVARLFGAIAGGLRRRGSPLPTNDIWIAATSANAGATLLTYDEHFRRIEATASRILKIDEE
jgi:tRNA(fMet)-specific endonuclease VapC